MEHPENLQTAIDAIAQLSPKGLIGKLRPLLPTIDHQIRAGVPRADIVEALQAMGMEVSLKYLDNAVYRWRKQQQAGAPPSSPMPSHQHTQTPQAEACRPHLATTVARPVAPPSPTPPGPVNPSLEPTPSPAISNKGDLARLRKARSPDLNALAQLGKHSTRRST